MTTPTSLTAIDTPATVRLATAAMGTRFELVLAGDDEAHLLAVGEDAIELIEDAHRRLSRFDKDSIVSRINRSPEPVPIDSELFELLELCICIRDDSNGAFDVALGGGLSLDPTARTAQLDGVRLFGGRLDLGGVAKGHAIDLAARSLRENGVTSALLHGGTSTVAAIGAPPDAPSWIVSVAHTGRMIELRDQTLSVSSPTGQVRAHIFDPRSGTPVTDERLAICVGPSAAETDAWSTALVVLGYRPASTPDEIESSIETPIPESENPHGS